MGQIISVQPAYVLSDRSGGRFTAIPCWRFATDNGEYILNILTGEVAETENLGVHSDTGTDDSFREELDSWDDGGSGEPEDTSWEEDADGDTGMEPETEPDPDDTVSPEPEHDTGNVWDAEG